jgi:CheY-like chemotaxis protein
MVFMDCDMPLMDGFTTTLVIRASTQASIPIIALTANSRARTERTPAELAFETLARKLGDSGGPYSNISAGAVLLTRRASSMKYRMRVPATTRASMR